MAHVLDIVIPFWGSCEHRLRNLIFCYNSLKNSTRGLNVRISVFVFDDGNPEVEHINIACEGSFNKAKKYNLAIQSLSAIYKLDWISFWDSDCFIDTSELSVFQKTVSSLKDNLFYGNNLNKLRSHEFVDPEILSLGEFFTFFSSGLIRGLGGVSFCQYKNFIKVGGFDEKYTEWGQEDEEIGKRLESSGVKFERLPFTVWHLPHPTHETKKGYWERLIHEN